MNAYEYYRRMAGLSQTRAAERIGVNQSTVSLWETGENNPRAEILPKVAEAYGTTVAALLNYTQPAAVQG